MTYLLGNILSLKDRIVLKIEVASTGSIQKYRQNSYLTVLDKQKILPTITIIKE